MGVSRNGQNSGQSPMVKKLEKKIKAITGVESTHGEGTEAGKTKDWLACSLTLLNTLSGVIVLPRADLSHIHEDGRGH